MCAFGKSMALPEWKWDNVSMGAKRLSPEGHVHTGGHCTPGAIAMMLRPQDYFQGLPGFESMRGSS